MGREQVLLIVIGVFVLVLGIMYFIQLRKDGNRKAWSFPLVVGLFIIGLVLMISPWFSVAKKINKLFESKPEVHIEYLRGDDLFSADRPMNDQAYQLASDLYAKGVVLYRPEARAFDSVEVVMNYFNQSIAAFGTAECYTARGQLKMQLTQMNEALVDYNRAIDIDDRFGRAYFNRGTLYYIMGDLPKACEDWEKARKLNVPNADQVIQEMCNSGR